MTSAGSDGPVSSSRQHRGGAQLMSPVLELLMIGIGYYIAARSSLLLQVQPGNIAVFWPASGLAAGALIALGLQAWGRVSAAVVLATIAANIDHGTSIVTAALFGACNAVECVLVAALTEQLPWRERHRGFALDSLRNVIGFLLAAVAGSGLAAVPAAMTIMHVFPGSGTFTSLWLTWFKSDGIGIVTVAPLLIALPAAWRMRLPVGRLIEGLGVLIVVVATAFHEFTALPADASWPTVVPLALLLPLLLWLAARLPPMFPAAGSLAIALVIVSCVVTGQGALGQGTLPLHDRVYTAQVAMMVLSTCALTLSALTEGQRAIADRLRTKEQRLRIATAAAGLGVFEWHIKEDRAVWENDRMYELFGHQKSDGALSFEQLLDHYLDPAERERVIADSQRSIQAGEVSAVIRVRRKDGQWRNIEIIGSVETEDNGEPVRIVGVMADITERRRSEERQALLIAELDHRVKNALERITSLITSTRPGASDLDGFVEAFSGRVHSMARAHQLLSREHWSGVDLHLLVREHLEPYDAPGRVSIEGPSFKLTADATQALSMVLHELATNAAKYGALSTAQGRVSVRWAVETDVSVGPPKEILTLSWLETDGPPVSPPQRSGFGTKVIRMPVVYELDGKVDLEYDPRGVRCRLRLPLERVAAP